MFEVELYRPVSRRKRLLIALLAVATAAFVTYSMTRKSGTVRNAALHPADVAVCAKGQTEGCVGGRAAGQHPRVEVLDLAVRLTDAVLVDPVEIHENDLPVHDERMLQDRL